MPRRMGKHLALSIGACILTVMMCDAALRWLGIQPVDLRPPIHRPSVIAGLEYELEPSIHRRGFRSEFVTTNVEGFRSPTVDTGKPSIVVLGDSYTFGFGVEDHETNPAVLARALTGWNVLNTGVNGYNIEQEARTYEEKARKIPHELVILEFTPNDADRKAYYNLDISARIRASSGSFHGPRWWYRTSPLVDMVRRGLANMARPRSSGPFVAEWTHDKIERYAEWLDRLTTSIGKKPKLLVLWPDYAERTDTFAAIRTMATERGWKILDLTQVFGTDFERLGWDSHPSATTQQRAGVLIADAVLALLHGVQTKTP